ncbi:hypothetical protein ABE178_28750 [Priestia megaterium]
MEPRVIGIEQEPFSKGKSKKKKEEAKRLRESVIKFHEYASLYRYPANTDITLQLRLTASGSNPPHLHSVSKNILDLLHKETGDATDNQRNRLLFEDDGQIKILEVTYHIETDPQKEIKKTETVAALKNLESKINSSIGVKDIAPLESEIEIKTPNIYIVSDTMDSFHKSLESLEKESRYDDSFDDDHFKDLLSEYSNNPDDANIKFMLQREALKNNDLKLHELIGLYSGTSLTWDILNREIKSSCRLGFIVPGLPDKGNKKQYKLDILELVNELISKNVYLSPLLMPISLTIIFMPPQKHGKQNEGKDLDNIAREYIIPAVHKSSEPHLSPPPSYLENMINSKIEKYRKFAELKTSLLPDGYPKSSSMRYQVICVPNGGSKYKDGGLIVLLGDLLSDSVLSQINESNL